MNSNLVQLLRLLAENNTDCILIGGMAANLHGSSLATFDCDVAIALDEQNLVRACRALAGSHAKFRHKDPPIWFDETAARSGGWKNIYLETDLGVLDCLGHVAGVGDYEACLAGSVEVEIDDFVIRVLDRETLIKAKLAAGRPKDLQAVAQLQVINGLDHHDE